MGRNNYACNFGFEQEWSGGDLLLDSFTTTDSGQYIVQGNNQNPPIEIASSITSPPNTETLADASTTTFATQNPFENFPIGATGALKNPYDVWELNYGN